MHSLKSLFEQGRDPMFITDSRGKFSHANPAFEKLFEYSSKEIIGKPMGVLLQRPLQDVLRYKQILRDLLKNGSWSGELHVISRNGEIIPVWTQMIRVDKGFSAIQVDMRERDKIARKMEGLSRLQTVATLAGGVAHEFNNILGGVQGHLYLLKRTFPGDLEKQEERFNRIDGLIRRAADLVQNLLELSKQKATTSKEIKVSKLLQETIDMAENALDLKIKISFHEKESGLVVFADPVLLKEHVFELMRNAESAILRKRSQFSANHLPITEHIDVLVSKTETQQCEITVHDNGAGMQEAILHQCCDPFFSTQPVGQGIGLGLSSVMAYAQHLKGSLEVESVIGEYTAVHFCLPIVKEILEKKARKGIVLLVDDDDDLRFSIEEILSHEGYEVLTASDGLKGLELWREHSSRFAAVVMDIVMPNMDGIEVAREIRKDNPNIPVCLMTGYSEQKIPASLGVNLMRKPIAPSLLLEFLSLS